MKKNYMITTTRTMKALKCKPTAQFAYNYVYNYSINVLSKCSNIISHRSSIFEGRHIAIIHLRRSTHRSTKVDTSIFEGRHIDLRRLTHRCSKVDTSIFEDRRRKHRNDNPTSHRHSDNSSPNIVHNGAP